MIYVTHDQVEAMTMADKIVVINEGIVEQVGSPLDLYNKPANRFVAGFIGSLRMNFLDFQSLPNDIKSFAPSDSNVFGIRPEHLYIGNEHSLKLKIKNVEQLGSDSYLYGETVSNQNLSINLNHQTDIKVNSEIDISFEKENAHWFNKDGISI